MTVVLIAVVCFGTGAAIRLLRRLPRLVFAASLIGAALLAAIVIGAPNSPIAFFGRALTLDDAARLFITASVALAAAFAFFGPLTFERATDVPAVVISNSQGMYFFWSLAPFVVAITLDSFPLAVFFWTIGLIVLMLAAQPQSEGRVGGAAQFLLITIIAGASLLLAQRFIELYPLTPENLDLVRSTVVFFALGLGLLLAAFPFNIWLGPLADEMPLLGMAFLMGVAQPVGLWLLVQTMRDVAWLVDKSPFMTILLWGGLLTAPIGALLAISERRDARLMAYLALIPLGHILVGLGLGTRLGLTGAMLAILSRAIGIALFAGGLSFVRHHSERRWQVVGALAVLGGGFALAGIPPMLGFAAEYSIYRDLAALNGAYVALLLASNAVALLVTLQAGWRVFVESGEAGDFSGELKIVPYLCTVIVLLLLAAVIVTGLFPQWIANPLIDALGQAAYLK